MSDNHVPFDFDDSFQLAVAGYMMHDKEFLEKCAGNIPHTLFIDPLVSTIVKILYDYYAKYKEAPTSLEEIYSSIKGRFMYQVAEQQRYTAKAQMCYNQKDRFNFKSVKDQLSIWFQLSVMKSGMEAIQKDWKAQKTSTFTSSLAKLVSDIEDASFSERKAFDFTKMKDFYEEWHKSLDADCCTLGNDDFDEMLRKGAKIVGESRDPAKLNTLTKGGLFPGQTTIILGASNAGKTTAVTTIVSANVLIGKRVLFIGHEQAETELVDKLTRCLSGLHGDELLADMIGNEGVRRRSVEQYCSRFLTYHHWIEAGNMYVEPVIALIKAENEKMKKINKGKGYDLLVVDYPGKLKSKLYANKSAASKHDETGYVYSQFVDIAKQEKFHSLLPAQVNRGGYAVNRGDSQRMLDQGDVADSYTIMQLADNVLSINRFPVDIANKRIKFYLTKCRSNTTGTCFVSKTNFAASRSHGWGLTATTFTEGVAVTDAELQVRGFNEAEMQAHRVAAMADRVEIKAKTPTDAEAEQMKNMTAPEEKKLEVLPTTEYVFGYHPQTGAPMVDGSDLYSPEIEQMEKDEMEGKL